jgi:transposase-like protein
MSEHDEEKRQAAVRLLKQGEASLSEVARLASVSRQVVRYWITAANIDWQAARRKRLKERWSETRRR